MDRYGLVGLAVCLALTGCGVSGGRTIDMGGSSGTSSWSDHVDKGQPSPFDEGTVIYAGTSLVMWTNQMTHESGMHCQNRTDGVSVSGEFVFGDGKKWEVKGESKDGKSGSVTVAGQAFEFADGNLFLVTGPSDRPRVKQLKRDLSGIDFQSQKSFQAFGAGDREMTAFFTGK